MSAPNRQETLLVVIIDDNASHADLLRKGVEAIAPTLSEAVEISCFSDPAEALASLTGETRSCVSLCDYQLDGTTALDWLPDFVRGNYGPMLVTTSCGSEQIAVGAFRQGAADYLNKANAMTDGTYLAHSIKECLRRHRLAQTVSDLSVQLRRANRELAYNNEQLKATTQAAHDFVDDVAHDFRTPIAVIKEFASIISDGLAGPVTDEQAEHLRYVDRATDQLAGMIDDFLDSTKLRAGLLRLDRRPVSPAELLGDIAPMAKSRARSKGVTFESDLPDGLPDIFVDPFKAERVLTNIIGNAVKFSPAGTAVRVVAEVLEPCWVRFTVVDAGPGIAQEDLALIFDRFKQAPNDEHARTKGFGLGLSIATQLVTINFGRLEVASELGDGSRFSMIVPQARPKALMQAYLHHLDSKYETQPLAMLRCTPGAGACADSIGEFLKATCRTNDLVRILGEREVLVAGPSKDPSAWVDRLEQASHKASKTRGDNSFRFATELGGVWERPFPTDEILGSIRVPAEPLRIAA